MIIRADHECELPAARLREAEVINLTGFLNDSRSDKETDQRVFAKPAGSGTGL
jgi:hypothetical protein